VIEEGEEVLAGLTREVEEETGLVVSAWEGPVYHVLIDAPDMGWRLRVEAHRAVAFEGRLRIDDPDGIVVDAGFFSLDRCHDYLRSCSPWVREPLSEWLIERWTDARPFRYAVQGPDRRTMQVTRM
jgi:8-oxo-dGTP diphosphatase